MFFEVATTIQQSWCNMFVYRSTVFQRAIVHFHDFWRDGMINFVNLIEWTEVVEDLRYADFVCILSLFFMCNRVLQPNPAKQIQRLQPDLQEISKAMTLIVIYGLVNSHDGDQSSDDTIRSFVQPGLHWVTGMFGHCNSVMAQNMPSLTSKGFPNNKIK